MSPIVRFEFLLEEGADRRWVTLQGSGGQLGNSVLCQGDSLRGQRLRVVREELLIAALRELRREGSVRIWHESRDPADRIEVAHPTTIRACREVRTNPRTGRACKTHWPYSERNT